MATKRQTASSDKPRRRPASTPEARERQLVALAVDVAETQLREGTASSQVIVHYLKMATRREELEREKLHLEAKLLEAKAEAVNSGRRVEEMYAEAMKAFKSYRGDEPEDDSDLF